MSVLPVAVREVKAARRWYEMQRPGLGAEFLKAFDAAIETIRRYPESREIVALRTRRTRIRRFPYSILYSFDGRDILVTAIFHMRRDPMEWAGRIRERVMPPPRMLGFYHGY